jgi:DHA2 family multidrug resistance protein-like MFS transporter
VFDTLGNRFGRKLALQAGVTIFGLASLAAIVADSAEQVIAMRAGMGVGAALIMPATLSIIRMRLCSATQASPSLRVLGRRHHESPSVTSGHSQRRIARTGNDSR